MKLILNGLWKIRLRQTRIYGPAMETFQVTSWENFYIYKDILNFPPCRRIMHPYYKPLTPPPHTHRPFSYPFHWKFLCIIANFLCGKALPLTSGCILVHTAVCLSAIVSLLAPLGPRWPTYTVALPAGPRLAYSTSSDRHKIESLTQNTKLYPIWQRSRWSRGEMDLTADWWVAC